MSGSRGRFLLAVVLAVLVVGTAAASLDGAGGSNRGATDDSAAGVGDGNGTGFLGENGSGFALGGQAVDPGGSPLLTAILGRFLTVVSLLALVGPVVYVAVVLWREGVRSLWETLKSVTSTVAVVVAVLAVIFALVWLVTMFDGDGGGGLVGTGTGVGGFGDPSGDAASVPSTDVPIPLVVVGLLVAVAFAGAVLSGAPVSGLAPSMPRSATPTAEPAGRATRPGTATGSTFGDVAASNDVYRAWRRLADAVDAAPTATPADVARLAVEDGFDPDAVRTVTRSFEAVRYGRRPPTEERTERVRRAIERIEEAQS